LLAGGSFEEVKAIITAADFESVRCAAVFRACATRNAAGKPCDVVLVTRELEAAGELSSVGGAAGVSELAGEIPDPANLRFYAEAVLDASLRRQAVEAGLRLTRDAADATLPADATLDAVRDALAGLQARLAGEAALDTLASLDTVALWRAREAAEQALVLVDVPALRERVRACRAETARRNGGGK
jgi:replicative DNA helicase